MKLYVIGLVSEVVGYKTTSPKNSLLFEIEVKSEGSIYKIVKTPYDIFRYILRKIDMYEPIGLTGDYMFGIDKELLMLRWLQNVEKLNEDLGKEITNKLKKFDVMKNIKVLENIKVKEIVEV